MDLSSATNPKRANVQATGRTTSSQQRDNSAPGTASMFNNAQNTVILGGSFNNTINNNFYTANRLDVLHKRVAPNAILNAGGRADEVRCHPGTREEVIDRIERWRDAEDDLVAPIFWLSGPAGAGKSAIMQTIAERCKAQGVPQANFFFFRADGSRSNISPLVATLLHQVIRIYPSLRDSIAGVFSDDPLILNSILEEQLTQLLVTPLRNIQRSSSSYSPLLVLIDGLDECDSENKHHQTQILRAFDKVFREHPCPFRLLVASRDESQITSAFNDISSPVLPLYLNSEYSPERDIRVFVDDQFKHVRTTHPLAWTLDAAWPSFKDIKGIVEKSSGQFIYAATVMRFISNSSASPALSLQRVRGAAQITAKSPFSHLDAIYTYILSQVDDQEALKDILHSQLLMNDIKLRRHTLKLLALLQILDPKYDEALVHSCVADLTSIARYVDDNSLLFHHASFSDYLRHKSRSGDYFVDIDAFNVKITSAVWKCGLGEGNIAAYGVLRLKKLPPDFLNTLCALEPSAFMNKGRYTNAVFARIYDLCTCEDDVMKYKQIIRGWINLLKDPVILRGWESDKHPPCSRTYFTMARLERNLATKMSDEIAAALRPETEFDIRETALWLNDLLHRIHSKYYSRETGIYQQLLKQWISWAMQNDIPVDNLDDLPSAQWYLRKSRLGKWGARHLKIGSDKK